MSDGGRTLRARLATGRLLVAPGACDPFTARIIERTGFEAIYLGGNAMAAALAKGQPFITLTETAAAVARVAAVASLPLIVDGGAGFGGPAHVQFAVRQLEQAGAAAIHFDDQPYPKEPRYHRGDGRLAPADEMCARLFAARQARRAADTMIVARTDALRVTRSLDETLGRARTYAAAGADAILVLDLPPADARRLAEALPGVPIAWIGGVAGPVPTCSEIAAGGFSLALYPFNTLAAINAAVGDLWAALRDTGEIAQPASVLARAGKDLLEIVRMQDAFDIEQAVRSPAGPV